MIYFWIGYCYVVISSLFCFILALITTFWVLNKSGVIDSKHTQAYRILSHHKRKSYQQMIGDKTENKYVSIMDTKSRHSSETPALTVSANIEIIGTPINDPNTLTLFDLLRTEYGFDAFIHHISLEFCVETLLSCVELTQFQSFYEVSQTEILLRFPKCIPRRIYHNFFCCLSVCLDDVSWPIRIGLCAFLMV